MLSQDRSRASIAESWRGFQPLLSFDFNALSSIHVHFHQIKFVKKFRILRESTRVFECMTDRTVYHAPSPFLSLAVVVQKVV